MSPQASALLCALLCALSVGYAAADYTLTGATCTVPENAPVGHVVCALQPGINDDISSTSFDSPPTSAAVVTLSPLDAANAPVQFALDSSANVIVTGTLDAELFSTYHLTVYAFVEGSGWSANFSGIVQVGVTSVNEAPAWIVNTTQSYTVPKWSSLIPVRDRRTVPVFTAPPWCSRCPVSPRVTRPVLAPADWP